MSIQRLIAPILYPNQHRVTRKEYDSWASEHGDLVRTYLSHGGIECPVLVRHASTSPSNRAVLVLCGNGQFAGDMFNALTAWAARDVYILEYMGYFDRDNRTSERAVKSQVDGFINAFPGISFDVVGYSLGTHFATWLAVHAPARVASLTLVYPFVSIAQVAGRWFPTLGMVTRYVLSGLLDTGAMAPKVRCPCRVFAAEHDRVCPPDQGRHLAALIPGATFTLVKGADHMTVPWDRMHPEN